MDRTLLKSHFHLIELAECSKTELEMALIAVHHTHGCSYMDCHHSGIRPDMLKNRRLDDAVEYVEIARAYVEHMLDEYEQLQLPASLPLEPVNFAHIGGIAIDDPFLSIFVQEKINRYSTEIGAVIEQLNQTIQHLKQSILDPVQW